MRRSLGVVVQKLWPSRATPPGATDGRVRSRARLPLPPLPRDDGAPLGEGRLLGVTEAQGFFSILPSPIESLAQHIGAGFVSSGT